MSASSHTINADLPPSSRETFFRFDSAAAYVSMRMMASYENEVIAAESVKFARRQRESCKMTVRKLQDDSEKVER
jgi:hypothetical protein